MDIGEVWTNIAVIGYEDYIRSIYQEAQQDIEKKTKEFLRKYKIKEAKYAKQVAEGKITQADFDDWKRGQVFQGKQWIAKKEQISDTLFNANTIASKILNEQMGSVFAINSNYQAYLLEHGAGINFGFNLYDSATVANLIKNNPQVLPYYKPKKSLDVPCNMKGITRQVTLGIIEGESLDKIATRMASQVAGRNKNTMLTNARTGMTMAQNSGRQIRLKEAEGMGIKVHKEWMATMDGHTRDAHIELDGQKRRVDEPFEVDGRKIMYPGDPKAHPSLVFNCRCTLVGDLDDYPAKYKRYDNIDGQPVAEMSFSLWSLAKGMLSALLYSKLLSKYKRKVPDVIKPEYEEYLEEVNNGQ